MMRGNAIQPITIVKYILEKILIVSGAMCVCAKSLQCVQLFMTLWTVNCQDPLSENSLGKNTGVHCHISSRVSSQPRDQTLMSYALAGGFFATGSTWEALSGEWN